LECGFLFKDQNNVSILNGNRGEKHMALSKKSKILIVSIVAIAVVCLIAVPYVTAQTSANPITTTKTLNAKGYAFQSVSSDTIKKYNATFSLTLVPTTTNGTVHLFSVTGGSVVVNGVTYTINSGKGGVLTGRHVVLLNSTGTGPDGQSVTFKFAARYSWAGGNLYTLKIGAKLLTDNGNYTLLMAAPIRR
jgi:hypothetical protein